MERYPLFSTVKMVILSKPVYRLKAISIETTAGFLAEIDKPILKFI